MRYESVFDNYNNHCLTKEGILIFQPNLKEFKPNTKVVRELATELYAGSFTLLKLCTVLIDELIVVKHFVKIGYSELRRRFLHSTLLIVCYNRFPVKLNYNLLC